LQHFWRQYAAFLDRLRHRDNRIGRSVYLPLSRREADPQHGEIDAETERGDRPKHLEMAERYGPARIHQRHDTGIVRAARQHGTSAVIVARRVDPPKKPAGGRQRAPLGFLVAEGDPIAQCARRNAQSAQHLERQWLLADNRLVFDGLLEPYPELEKRRDRAQLAGVAKFDRIRHIGKGGAVRVDPQGYGRLDDRPMPALDRDVIGPAKTFERRVTAA
jgi:hypothetical protein